MKYILSMLCMLMMMNAYAEEIFPAGCQALVVKDELVTLSANKGQHPLIMIHNLSTVDLWITHPVSDPHASAGWSTQLQRGNWAALSLDKKTFELSCIESSPGHEQQVPCAGMLSICQWPNVPSPKTASGTFWVGEDMSLSALTAHIGSRGFILPASTQ